MHHRSAKLRPRLSIVATVAKRQTSSGCMGFRRSVVRSRRAPSPSRPTLARRDVASIRVAGTARAPSVLGTGWHKMKRESDSSDVDVAHCWIVENRTSKCGRARRNAIARQGQTLTSDFSVSWSHRPQRVRSVEDRSYVPTSQDVRDPNCSFHAGASALAPLRGSTSHG
jgi:hypothetical protein